MPEYIIKKDPEQDGKWKVVGIREKDSMEVMSSLIFHAHHLNLIFSWLAEKHKYDHDEVVVSFSKGEGK